jgi:ligand-binding sensor domain-containing protein/serine phosphatase RsbU (regulator of sigma subunit)
MKMKRHIFTLLCTIFFVFTTLAQSNNVKFERYSIETGLSSNEVFQVYQDSKGFIWIATKDGLNRYDGYHFISYKANQQDSKALQSNVIQYVYEDRQNMMWIGTEDGLVLFDDAQYVFSNIPININTPLKKINKLNVGFMYEDKAGNFWIATNGEGLNLFDRKTKTFKTYLFDANNPSSIRSNYVKSIAEEQDGTLWIATDGGISVLKQADIASGKFTHYEANPANTNAIPSKYVKGICIDDEQTVWIGSDGGVSKLTLENRQKGVFKVFAHKPENPNSLSNDYVKDIYLDSKGNLWVCADAGVSRLSKSNRNTGNFDNFRHLSNDASTIIANYTKRVFEDKNGQIWVSCYGGVSKFDPQRERFELYQYNPNVANSLPNNNIRAIFQEPNSTMWIGTENGLVQWSNGQFKLFSHNANNANSLVNNYVNYIISTKTGELWVATDGGVSVRQANGGFKHFKNNPADSQSICLNTVNSILEDKNGTLWFGTWEGIARLDKENRAKGIFKNYPTKAYSSTGNGQVQHIFEDKDEQLWFATKSGLIKYMAATDKFEVLGNKKEPNQLLSIELSVLYETDNKGIWVGTLGGGLNYFDKQSNKFTAFTEDDGLPSNFVGGILADNLGNLWLSTTKGLCKFTPPKNLFDSKDRGTYKNFTDQDGLQGNDFLRHAAYKTAEGKLYFGGTHGLNAFFPEKIQEGNNILPVYITDFKLFNKSVKIGVGSSFLLSKSITDTKELKLSYLDNFFSFDFTALNFRNTAKNHFAYKMEGFDKDWIYVEADKRFATYTNLSSGEYIFRVKAANSLGIWNENGVSLKITIEPPIWEKWWFRLLGLMIVIGAVVALYKYRVRQIEARRKELETLVQIRTAEVVKQRDEILLQKDEITKQNYLLEEQKQEIIVQNEELSQQQEEILSQRDHIGEKNRILEKQKTEIEKSYQNITVLSEIGQKITASLNVDTLISTVYENVNKLMYASAFGIGIFDKEKQTISYSGFIERGEILPYHQYNLTDTENLSVYCVAKRAEILINDLRKEIYNYLPHFSKDLTATYGDMPESLIYLPLLLDNEVSGVITVQSFQQNAYNQTHVAILKTLASYIAVALDNSKAYTEIAKAKEAIAFQNTKMTDSIRYGETIQQAMLPNERELSYALGEYFILFRPKDIVSGDFYWLSRVKDKIFVAVVDCTGHGVPGAFMSMIGMSLLHEAINQKDMYEAAEVLEYINSEIRLALKQDETTNRDGMDVALCRIKTENNLHEIMFAGAKRPLFYTQHGELHEIKGSRKNIGGRQKEESAFEQEKLHLSSGEMIYLSTDGYTDQANGKREKLGLLQLRELLTINSNKTAALQKTALLAALETHQQSAEQRDDITVMGIRLR